MPASRPRHAGASDSGGETTIQLPTFARGVGPTVVLVHGRGADHGTWAPTLPYLQDYQSVSLDLVGHGDAPAPLEGASYTIEAQAQDLAHTLTAYEGPFVLVGHSMGGSVAIHYALQQPEALVALVLVCSAARPPHHHPTRKHTQAVYETLAALAEEAGMAAVCEAYDREIAPLDPQGRALLMRFAPHVFSASIRGGGAMQNYEARLPELHIPTLVVAGAKDEVFVHEAHRMAERLPMAEARIFADAGHGPQLECAKAFGQALRRFLETHHPHRC